MAEPVSLQTVLTYLTLISVPVGVFYHIMTLRNTRKNQELQLETRQAQMFMQIYNQLNDAGLQNALQKVLPININNYKEFEELFSRDTAEGLENLAALDRIVGYYEGVGVLVKEGLLDIKYVALLICGMTILLWEKWGPYAKDIRKYFGSKRWASEWEYLYNELVEYLENHPELKP
jgi:hypothetical protein